MLRFFRFLTSLLMLVWLGSIITLTFYVAPSLFADESGQVPNSTVAADIIGPLLHKMEVTGWILIPILIGLQVAVWKKSGGGSRRAVAISCTLLCFAWGISIANGTVLTDQMRSIRTEMKAAHGGYHLAPDDDPERRRFAMLHGISMSLSMAALLMGLGSLYCCTELIGRGAPKESLPPT